MISAFRAEISRLMRRKVLLGMTLAVLAFVIGGAAIVLASATPATPGGAPSRAPTFDRLAEAGGGTDVFRLVASFAGTFVFVVFVGLFALEFSRGTYRTMLLRQPQRIRLLAGRLLGLLTVAAVSLAVAEILTWLAAKAFAPAFDVSTGAWVSADALGEAVADYGLVLVWVIGYAVLAMMIAVLLRSVPLALAVGIAWAGPLEHLLQDAWGPAQRVFPGLLLEVVAAGGVTDVSLTRAITTVTAYAVVAAGIAAAVFARRDVSS
jgi:hypothetical protein